VRVLFHLRVGKVSMEVCSEASFRNTLSMRTRPRPSDDVARVHNVRWTLVSDGPKRSEDAGKHGVRAYTG